MANRTVIVAGGGVGGVTAASRLRKRLAAGDQVVLVDREPNHLFQPSLLWLAVGKRKPDRIQWPLARLRRRGVDIVRGEVTAVGPERRSVRIGSEDLEADALVIALGAALEPERVPGLSAGGHNLYTLEGASAAAAALAGFRGGRVVVLTAAPVYKCPAAPYEAAMLVRDFLERRGLGRDAEVEIFAAEPGPMGTAGPEVSAAVRAMVEAEGVGYHPERQVASVDPDARRIRFDDGSSEAYDLLLYVPPHAPPAVIREAGLLTDGGWVPVDPRSLATDMPGVYAIGDVTGIPIPSGKMLPKAGVFAHRQAEVVAENLAAEWSGREPSAAFDGTGACFIETGGGRAGYGAGNFYASPAPEMRLHRPARRWHWGKVLFEKRWLWGKY